MPYTDGLPALPEVSEVAATAILPSHFNAGYSHIEAIHSVLGSDPAGGEASVSAAIASLQASSGGGGAAERTILQASTPSPYADVAFSSSDPFKKLLQLPPCTPELGIMFHVRAFIYTGSTAVLFLRVMGSDVAPGHLPMVGTMLSYGSSHRIAAGSFWFPWVGLGEITPRIFGRFAAGPGNFNGIAGTVYGGGAGSGMGPFEVDYEVV